MRQNLSLSLSVCAFVCFSAYRARKRKGVCVWQTLPPPKNPNNFACSHSPVEFKFDDVDDDDGDGE